MHFLRNAGGQNQSGLETHEAILSSRRGKLNKGEAEGAGGRRLVCEPVVGSILPIEDIPYSGLKPDRMADIGKCFL